MFGSTNVVVVAIRVTFSSTTLFPLSICFDFWVFFALLCFSVSFTPVLMLCSLLPVFRLNYSALHKSLVMYITVWSRRLSLNFSYCYLLYAYICDFSLSLFNLNLCLAEWLSEPCDRPVLLPHTHTHTQSMYRVVCVCICAVFDSAPYTRSDTLKPHIGSLSCSLLVNHMRDPSIYWFIVSGSIHFDTVKKRKEKANKEHKKQIIENDRSVIFVFFCCCSYCFEIAWK